MSDGIENSPRSGKAEDYPADGVHRVKQMDRDGRRAPDERSRHSGEQGGKKTSERGAHRGEVHDEVSLSERARDMAECERDGRAAGDASDADGAEPENGTSAAGDRHVNLIA